MLEKKKLLHRKLNLLDVFSIAAGAMISSGLFVLPGLAFAKAGPAVVVAYILAGIIVIPSMLAQIELGTAMPKAGGSYFYIERSMGPAAGTLGGFASWFSLALKSAFALIGIGAFAHLLFPGFTGTHIKLIAIAFCILFALLNIKSVKNTSRFQVTLVLSLLAMLFLYCIFGVTKVNLHNFIPFSPKGIGAVIPVVGLVFVSFGGLTKVASIAEEIKKPKKNLPLGMLLAFIVVMFFYVAVIFVTVGVVNANKLANSLTPISQGGEIVLGQVGMLILSIAALFAFFSTANAGILSASRFPMAMSRDNLLPGIFKKMTKKSGTPLISIIVTAAFMIFMIAFLNFENLVKAASTMKIILFLYTNIALIVMRESRIDTYQPSFRVPLYPWLPIIAIIIYAFLIFEMGTLPLLITGFFVILCLAWYIFYVRRRVVRKSALIHIVERVMNKKISSTTLTEELKEILIRRDNIVEDRFDKLVKSAVVLDIERPIEAKEFFKFVSEQLTSRLKIPSQELHDLFVDREQQSSTILEPGLAIPHIIVPGLKKFDILIVRCKDGIKFDENEPPVHTVFVLIGSMDERNFHLRALMSIAQIVKEQNFYKRWFAAKNIEELRNIIYLSSRKRETHENK
ncbi:MAG: amino acid permease [Candidatus Cloacimonetes bacterium]|nr:amino acid permease [Candidatus Cloacimonadota bacterium]